MKRTRGRILNEDYTIVLKMAKKNDFVFMDPPYIEDHDYGFKYNRGERLDKSFTEKLAKECKKLDKRGVLWMMTQTDTKQKSRNFQRLFHYGISCVPS